MLSDRTLAYGERMARALLGLDALYREESSDSVGLAVVNLDGAGELAPEELRSYADATARFTELRDEARELEEPDRRRYYDDLCASKLSFTRWRDEGLPFEQQLSEFLHVPPAPAPDGAIAGLEQQLGSILSGLDYSGSLHDQCAAWEEAHRVPTTDVESELQSLMDEAWEITNERLLEIPAPRDDAMRVRTVSGAAFNARCSYVERTVEINTDPVLTRPGLRHLAVHEGCPGHYVQFKLREVQYQRGLAPADGLLSLVNSASSCVFEGIADAGLRMVGWHDDPDDRVQSLLNRHRAGIGTGAAWRLHQLGWETDRVASWLRERALIGGSGWVDNRMGFISAPSRAVLIWSYWWGEPVVAATWEAHAESAHEVQRREYLGFLYGRMHSNASVTMFAHA